MQHHPPNERDLPFVTKLIPLFLFSVSRSSLFKRRLPFTSLAFINTLALGPWRLDLRAPGDAPWFSRGTPKSQPSCVVPLDSSLPKSHMPHQHTAFCLLSAFSEKQVLAGTFHIWDSPMEKVRLLCSQIPITSPLTCLAKSYHYSHHTL